MSKEVSAIIFGNQDQLVSCISCNFNLTEQIYLVKPKRYTIMFFFFLTTQTVYHYVFLFPQNSDRQWLGIVNATSNGTSQAVILVVEFDTGHNFTEDAPNNHVGININNINSIQQIQYSSMAPKKFRLRDLTKATYGFSLENKLGQGGFGTMYKGLLENKEAA